MNIVTFYVNDISHPSIFLTEQDALDACSQYISELNAWWASMWPEDIYMDESYIILDQINPIPERFGIVPNWDDNPPLPTFEGYELKELDWSEWVIW